MVVSLVASVNFDKSQRDKSQSLTLSGGYFVIMQTLSMMQISFRGHRLTLLILQLQSDFKGIPGLQILISLQNNGKPRWIYLKYSYRREITHRQQFYEHFSIFVSPSLQYETLFAIKGFSLILFLYKRRINCTQKFIIYMNKNIYVKNVFCFSMIITCNILP